MFKGIFNFIQDKQQEARKKEEQRDLDVWFNTYHGFSEDIIPETQRIFETLTIDEPIKLVCDFHMPLFDSTKYSHEDPAKIKKLREYYNQDFGIAIYTEKTNVKIGYLPMLINVEPPELYRKGTWLQAIHNLLRKNVKVHAKLVKIERNDNPVMPINQSSLKYQCKGIYNVGLLIHTDLEKLNKKVQERIQELENRRKEREIEEAKWKYQKANTKVYVEDDLSFQSIWDEYDEDGVPYSEHRSE